MYFYEGKLVRFTHDFKDFSVTFGSYFQGNWIGSYSIYKITFRGASIENFDSQLTLSLCSDILCRL